MPCWPSGQQKTGNKLRRTSSTTFGQCAEWLQDGTTPPDSNAATRSNNPWTSSLDTLVRPEYTHFWDQDY